MVVRQGVTDAQKADYFCKCYLITLILTLFKTHTLTSMVSGLNRESQGSFSAEEEDTAGATLRRVTFHLEFLGNVTIHD